MALPPRLTYGVFRAATRLVTVAALVAASSFAANAPASAAAAAVPLGTAAPFGVLGGSAVTNTGPTVVNGDLGLWPSTALSGFPPGIVNGATHVDDAVAKQAQSDLTVAYNNAAGQAADFNLSGQDLGGLTLTTGVYKYDVSAQLTGTVTLDAQGDPNAIFIFQIGSTLTTASDSAVALINGAQACHVFWQVGSSATLGTTTDFAGTILALTSITANTGATVDGRLLARNGAVTLDTNTIDVSVCAGATLPTSSVTKTANPTSLPNPGGAFNFTVDVQNTGSTSVALTSLNDSVYGDLNGRGTCATGGTITAGSTYSCTFSGTFLGAPGDSETDVVTAVITDANGDAVAGSDDATVTVTPGPTGIIEICKRGDTTNGPVTGAFTFTFAGQTATVPVGYCSGPITVAAGSLTVSETPRPGFVLVGCETRRAAQLTQCDPPNSSATVDITAGGIAVETVLTMINSAAGASPVATTPTTVDNSTTAPLKICKIAGNGVAVGTDFRFNVTGRGNVTIPAGPASQGGYCRILSGFTRGSTVTVTEALVTGTQVSAITVQPADRRVSSSTVNRTVKVRIGRGFTIVTFTNRT